MLLIGCFEIFSLAMVVPFNGSITWIYPSKSPKIKFPLKLIAFDQAVNTTLGLPFVRTSPDHGTALDIADKFKAREQSMIAAINNAWILSQ